MHNDYVFVVAGDMPRPKEEVTEQILLFNLQQEIKHQIAFCIVVSTLGLWPRFKDVMNH